MVKYLVMKQRYSLRSNSVKLKAIAFILIAFFMGGKTAWAQNVFIPWFNPNGSSESVFYLVTNPDNSEQFYVYGDASNTGLTNIGPYDYMCGPSDMTGSKGMKLIFLTSAPVKLKEKGFVINDLGSNTVTFELGENINLQSTITNPNITIPDGFFSYSSNVTLQISDLVVTSNSSYTGIFFLKKSAHPANRRKIVFIGLDSDLKWLV